jgi:hypothetical protein
VCGIELPELTETSREKQTYTGWLRYKAYRDSITKETLAILANRELGLSKSALMHMSKDDMNRKIDNAIKNIDALDTIAKIARRQE